MLFPTISFVLFFILTFSLYWGTISIRLQHDVINSLRKWVLLLASYVFYGLWDWRFLPLLIGSTWLSFCFARILLWLQQEQDRSSHLPSQQARQATGSRESLGDGREARRLSHLQSYSKITLGIAITLNLSVLVFFKYINWLLLNTNTVLHALGLPLIFTQLTILLPLGISFFIFQNISFLMDIYRRKLISSGSYVEYSLYIAFFPQLIAGPIVRASSILPQLQRLPNPQNIYLSDAFTRILLGLFKKVFIANTLSTSFVDPVFLLPSAHSSVELLLAAYAYSAVIYCDFSAYSDIAVGLGLLCGIRLMENFDRPYGSTSLQGFWRRWHISLSTWLRDYLYIPMGGSRKGNRYVNIFITMLLGGLWHGAAWTFLLWGALHGVVIGLEHGVGRLLRKHREAERKGHGTWASLLGWLYSFHFVTLTWILFRAPSFEVAGQYFSQLLRFDFHTGGSVKNIILLSLLLGILPQILLPKGRILLAKLLDTLPIVAQILVFAGSVALLQVLMPEGVAPFIYYQF